MQVKIKRYNHDLDEALYHYKERGVNVEWHENPYKAGVIVFFLNVVAASVACGVLTIYLDKVGMIGIVCDDDMEIEMEDE